MGGKKDVKCWKSFLIFFWSNANHDSFEDVERLRTSKSQTRSTSMSSLESMLLFNEARAVISDCCAV